MESELTRWRMNRKCQAPHKRASDKTREAGVGERRRGTVGDGWGQTLARNNVPRCPKEAAAVGGRGRANLAGGRLGGPLSPRAGRVAKEMTARSAAPSGRGLKRRRFRFRSLSAPVPLPPPGPPRAFHRHLALAAQPGPLLPRAHPGLRLRRRHGSRSVRLPLRPPVSRRHGCLPLPAQHGEVLRGRGRHRRLAAAAALRLLRHARLARLHGGEAGGAHRLTAVGREPDGEREPRGGMGSSPGKGPNREPVTAAANWGATARAEPGPRGSCRC